MVRAAQFQAQYVLPSREVESAASPALSECDGRALDGGGRWDRPSLSILSRGALARMTFSAFGALDEADRIFSLHTRRVG